MTSSLNPPHTLVCFALMQHHCLVLNTKIIFNYLLFFRNQFTHSSSHFHWIHLAAHTESFILIKIDSPHSSWCRSLFDVYLVGCFFPKKLLPVLRPRRNQNICFLILLLICHCISPTYQLKQLNMSMRLRKPQIPTNTCSCVTS